MSVRSARSRWVRFGVIFFVCLVAGIPAYRAWKNSEAEKLLANGRQYLRERRSELAEQSLASYLKYQPDDHQAVIQWAEAVIDGKSRKPADAARLACEALAGIPDASPFAAEARMREARLTLFVLLQPEKAESLLQKSRTLDPAPMDVHFLLWKVFDLTERFQFAEPHFWATYERSPEEIKTNRLAEWYLSQFSTNSANASLDRLLGFIAADQTTSEQVVVARLDSFVEHEPESTLNLTAKAAFLLHLREREAAGKLLDQADLRADSRTNEFFLATRISYLLDLGRLKEADSLFEQWNAAKDGYPYFKTLARIQQLVRRDDKGAVENFEKAIQLWPGPVDWSNLHFMAQSMARLGDRTGAEQTRAKAKEVELLMEMDVHRTLRAALNTLNSPESLQQFEDFYSKIGRETEANAWRSRREALKNR
ncbi:MAG: hypothetical protein JNM43_22550 [Planctomycetaceae bacterium]|nr:hypothetical protein [Planctomycetaceae bacterium]